MFITTSRDPSAKARRFARALASFLSVTYVNRGKQRPDSEETWLVVTEDHGNPAGLVKRYREKEERVAFRLSGELAAVRMRPSPALVVGEEEMAAPIARLLDLKWQAEAGDDQGRMVRVAPGSLDFLDRGEMIFRLKI